LSTSELPQPAQAHPLCELTPPRPEDAGWMQRALEQAWSARSEDEVPVGAIVVAGGKLIAEASNRTRTWSDPTGHAELVAVRRAAERLGGWRLLDATVYVTLEPCAMCAGAMVLARVSRLVYAAADPKAGMCGSLACIVQDARLNHRVDVTSGVLGDQSAELLRGFFRARR
jgi:tRNA(adenine34) deaminase